MLHTYELSNCFHKACLKRDNNEKKSHRSHFKAFNLAFSSASIALSFSFSKTKAARCSGVIAAWAALRAAFCSGVSLTLSLRVSGATGADIVWHKEQFHGCRDGHKKSRLAWRHCPARACINSPYMCMRPHKHLYPPELFDCPSRAASALRKTCSRLPVLSCLAFIIHQHRAKKKVDDGGRPTEIY